MVKEFVKVTTLKPGDRFIDEDGDLSEMLHLKTREVKHRGEPTKVRLYNTIKPDGTVIVPVVAIPVNTVVRRAP